MKHAPSFPLAIALALPLALTACNGNTTANLAPTPGNPLDPEENAIVFQLNALRAQKGLSQVTACFSLNVSAAAHSDDMRDNNYLSDVSPTDMSTVRTRACTFGYKAACGTSIPMAELVAEGNGTGNETFAQWESDMTAGPILVEPPFVVVGLGRSIGADNERWTLDLASMTDPSCN
jgi:uncharacterized protein YkwD